MIEILALGILLGLQHALEADHLAAMATLASDGGSLGAVARRGVAWGIGHSLTLLALGGTALLLGTLIPPQIASLLEFAVGLMLVLLGADVLRRLRSTRSRPPRCLHDGAPGAARQCDRERRPERQRPAPAFPVRALCVGVLHGMAGSAALVLLTLQTARSPAEGLTYIALFGAGSILGMGVLGALIGLPLGWTARAAAGTARGLNVLIGCASAALGLWLMYSTGIVAVRG